MALTTQLGAVTNRRIKPNYVDIINQQTKYLPALYQRKDDQAYRDKMYDLSNRSLEQNEMIASRNEALRLDALEEQKDQANKARKLGYASLGLQGLGAAGGLYNAYNAASDAAAPVASTATSIIPEITSGVANQAPLWDFASGAAPEASGLTDLANIVPGPVKAIGSGLWDIGSSIYEGATNLFSGLFS